MFEILKIQIALLKDRRGVTAVEYAVIAGVLVLAIGGAFTQLGTTLTNYFTNLKL
ncbi:MAG: Flp family type IVb pilin [Acetobacteraceae bacterium]|nr:Flp family type IVb pilin [Acetobacteraceae bacterium]